MDRPDTRSSRGQAPTRPSSRPSGLIPPCYPGDRSPAARPRTDLTSTRGVDPRPARPDRLGPPSPAALGAGDHLPARALRCSHHSPSRATARPRPDRSRDQPRPALSTCAKAGLDRPVLEPSRVLVQKRSAFHQRLSCHALRVFPGHGHTRAAAPRVPRQRASRTDTLHGAGFSIEGPLHGFDDAAGPHT